MTCVVGIKTAHGILLAADSAGADSVTWAVRNDAKLFTVETLDQRDTFLVGYTTSFRMGQILRYSFQPPIRSRTTDPFQYLATDWIDAVRECFKDKGFTRKEPEGEEAGGEFLVGFAGRLFTVEGDYQIAENADNYAAIGSGRQVAYGALYATTQIPSAKERAELAIRAAAHHTPFVREPVHCEWLSAP